VVEACATVAGAVVLHLPRSLGPLVETAFELASHVLVVVTLDVFAFRSAKRALYALDRAARWDVVVNRAARGSIVPSDVERVFGRRALTVLPFDRRVCAAQDRGEMAPDRSPVRRGVRRLVGTLLEEAE
jgi:Flp pilus assembly CpaE family ATPase